MTHQQFTMKFTKERPDDGQEYMNRRAFVELRRALEEALAYERGTNRELIVTQIQKPLKGRLSKKTSATIRRRS